MKVQKKLSVLLILPLLASCGAYGNSAAEDYAGGKSYWDGSYSNDSAAMEPGGKGDDEAASGDEYLSIVENNYRDPTNYPNSSFSLDSSSGAYSNIRNSINNNSRVETDAVIIEQMINYFDYPDYPSKGEEPVTIYSETSDCPWNNEAVLASVAVTTKKMETESTNGNNYVLLIDVSGSMYSSKKLPLVKKGFSLLVDQLSDNDIVSIVTYSAGEKTVIDGAKGNEKSKIKDALEKLEAKGSTNGEKGIDMAYALAEKYFIEDGNNQILLATDGDFNVGKVTKSELAEMVKKKQETGINFSCFGFGMGNYKDTTMQTLALNGNGNVFYIDDESELERRFSGDISSILKVVSKDSKIQVSFTPEKVSKYRLIGYENRTMTDAEFNDESKDAGEIYSNRTVVALYEIYAATEDKDDLFDIKFRYKDPSSNESNEIVASASEYTSNASSSYTFASLVAQFGLFLRNSKFKGTSSLANIEAEYDENKTTFDEDYLKKEFRELVGKCESIYSK